MAAGATPWELGKTGVQLLLFNSLPVSDKSLTLLILYLSHLYNENNVIYWEGCSKDESY